MRFLVDGKSKQISLFRYSNQYNTMSPDVFDELEENFPEKHECTEESCEIICTASEYAELVQWWAHETEAYNDRKPYNWFVENLSAAEIEAEYAAGDEYILDADPV